GIEPVGETPPVGQVCKRIRLHLTRQACDVADRLCDRPCEPGCECGSKEEGESSSEKDEAPIARGDRIDGCNRLDREDRRMRDAELRACCGELRSAEPDPTPVDLT